MLLFAQLPERNGAGGEHTEQTDDEDVVVGHGGLRRRHAPSVVGKAVAVRRGVVHRGTVVGERLVVGLLEAPPHEQAREHDEEQEDEPDGGSHASVSLSQRALSPVC